MNKAKPTPSDFEAQYREILPRLDRCAFEMEKQLAELFSIQKIVLGFPIQKRVKTWASLLGKLQAGVVAAKHVSDIQDLVGIRLILLFRKDIAIVQKLLKDNLSIVKEYDTAKRLKEDQFGYSSYHFVATIPDAWCSVPTLKDLRGIQAEIQVRTVAQHIWAEASHSLQYKSEVGVPPAILRGVYRVSALLETVDLEFDRVLDERDRYRNQTRDLPASEPLNVDLLRQVLMKLLPKNNGDAKDENDSSELLEELSAFKIRTIEDLKQLIHKQLKAALVEDAQRVSSELKTIAAGVKVSARTRSRLESGAFFTHVGLVRNMLRLEFGDDALRRIFAKRGGTST